MGQGKKKSRIVYSTEEASREDQEGFSWEVSFSPKDAEKLLGKVGGERWRQIRPGKKHGVC